MKKSLLVFGLLTLISIKLGLAQEKKSSIPLILVVDNEFLESEIFNCKLLITDRTGNAKDSIICDYRVGKLLMFKSDYKRLLKIKADTDRRFYFHFVRTKLDMGTDFAYKIQFLDWQINDNYIVLKVFNEYDKDSQQRFIFKKGKSYLYQIMTPGFIGVLPRK